jgi:hypothetical protein
MQCLHNLGSTLKMRYHDTQDIHDLNRSIEKLEQAVALLTPNSQHVRASYLSNLANALYLRFERTENIADLDRAKELKTLASSPN